MNLKNRLTLLFMLFIFGFSFCQRGEAILILKDSTEIKGKGRISGISSIVSVRFRNDTLKYRAYKPSEIIGIDILENDYYRKFRYKNVKDKKFPEIMEIVSIDSLSLYVRVYEDQPISDIFPDGPPKSNIDSHNILPDGLSTNIIMENSQFTPNSGWIINNGYSTNTYSHISISRYSYYVGRSVSDDVEHLYTKGLPFAKSFKKSMKQYFKDCPELVEKVEKKEFSNDDLAVVLKYYNEHCFSSKTETQPESKED